MYVQQTNPSKTYFKKVTSFEFLTKIDSQCFYGIRFLRLLRAIGHGAEMEFLPELGWVSSMDGLGLG
jgi:hypothetical protein